MPDILLPIIALHTDDEGQLEKVDLLMANILAKPLVGLCEHFSTAIAKIPVPEP
jgi:ribosomal protein L11 methyltransferase